MECLKELLKAGASLLQTDSRGQTPLIVAAKHGHLVSHTTWVIHSVIHPSIHPSYPHSDHPVSLFTLLHPSIHPSIHLPIHSTHPLFSYIPKSVVQLLTEHSLGSVLDSKDVQGFTAVRYCSLWGHLSPSHAAIYHHLVSKGKKVCEENEKKQKRSQKENGRQRREEM